jgi:general secretion pathway protein I
MQKGFTLIEVLIALAIVSISALGLSKLSDQSIKHSSYLELKTFANLAASNLAKNKRLNGGAVIGFDNGNYQLAKQTWLWTSHINATPNPDIFKLEMSVFQNKQQQEQDQHTAKYTLYLPK